MNPILRFFNYEHLSPELQTVSAPFYYLAHQVEETLPNNAEKSTALRKLLEAKDAAVRAALPEDAVPAEVPATPVAPEPTAEPPAPEATVVDHEQEPVAATA